MERFRDSSFVVWWATCATILLIGIVSLQLWGLTLFGNGVDHEKAGSWGDIISGTSSAAALIVAVGALVGEQRRLRRSRETLEVQRLTDVYCWLEYGIAAKEPMWILKFVNQTKIPIFKWRVYLSMATQVTVTSVETGPIRPGESEMILNSLGQADPSRQPPIVFEFVDPQGGAWQRSARAETAIKIVSF